MNIVRHVLDFLFPPRCASCEGAAPSGALFCDACVVSLVPGGEACCPHCGLVYLEPDPVTPDHLCGACAIEPPPWRWARAAYAYGGALQHAVARWKNAPDQTLGPALGRLLARAGRVSPDVVADGAIVVPVPGHRQRLRQRGFSPAGILARAVSDELRLPLVGTALTVARPISSKGLGRKARRRRVRGAFRVSRPRRIAGRPVLLVDDVMTTGATAEAITRALLRAGATRVDVLVLARVGR